MVGALRDQYKEEKVVFSDEVPQFMRKVQIPSTNDQSFVSLMLPHIRQSVRVRITTLVRSFVLVAVVKA